MLQTDATVKCEIFREDENGNYSTVADLTQTVKANLPSTENVEVAFNLADGINNGTNKDFVPQTYSDLQPQYNNRNPRYFTMMEANVTLERSIWHKLNAAWSLFFVVMGSLNLYVAYYYDTDAWVNFKLFGGVGFTLIFVLIQALYLTKHMDEKGLGKQ